MHLLPELSDFVVTFFGSPLFELIGSVSVGTALAHFCWALRSVLAAWQVVWWLDDLGWPLTSCLLIGAPGSHVASHPSNKL